MSVPGASWKQADLAASFAERRRILVPLLDEQMLANAVRAERESGGTRSEQEVDCEDDDDQPDSAEDQVRWLRDVGFEQAEVQFKWAEAVVFGAIKPS